MNKQYIRNSSLNFNKNKDELNNNNNNNNKGFDKELTSKIQSNSDDYFDNLLKESIKKIDSFKNQELLINISNEPISRIEQKYFNLINEALRTLNTSNLYNELKLDFYGSENLMKIFKEINLLIDEIKNIEDKSKITIKIADILKTYEVLVLLMKYDADNWSKLSAYNKGFSGLTRNDLSLSYKIFSFLNDFQISEEFAYNLDNKQIKILKLVSEINYDYSIDDVNEIMNKYNFSSITLSTFNLLRATIDLESEDAKEEFNQLLFITVFKMFADFINENILNKLIH